MLTRCYRAMRLGLPLSLQYSNLFPGSSPLLQLGPVAHFI